MIPINYLHLMNIKQLSDSLVGSKHFKWMDGVKLAKSDTRIGPGFRAAMVIESDRPDLEDAATLGCILSMIRAKYGRDVFFETDSCGLSRGMCASEEENGFMAITPLVISEVHAMTFSLVNDCMSSDGRRSKAYHEHIYDPYLDLVRSFQALNECRRENVARTCGLLNEFEANEKFEANEVRQRIMTVFERAKGDAKKLTQLWNAVHDEIGIPKDPPEWGLYIELSREHAGK